MLDCQSGALGELADELSGVFTIIEEKLELVQDKINSIPGFVDASLVADIAKMRKLLDGQFPQLADILDLQLDLPGEIMVMVDLITNLAAFRTAAAAMKEKYADADLLLLREPENILALIRGLGADLNRLCDLVPKLEKDEEGNVVLKGRGNTKIEELSRPGIQMKSLASKEGRITAAKNILDSILSIRIVYVREEGTGNLTTSGYNPYY